MSVGTGAFSSVEAERGVEVSVEDDEDAYLGIGQLARVIPVSDSDAIDQSQTEVISVYNQFSDSLSLGVINESESDDVEIVAEDPIEVGEEPRGDENSNGLSPGSEGAISIKCDSTGSVELVVTFYGDTGGTTVDATRRYSISVIDVEFVSQGNGNNEKGGGVVRITGEFPEVSLKINDEDSGTISSDGDTTTIEPDGGDQINSVTLDGVNYTRDDNSSDDGD